MMKTLLIYIMYYNVRKLIWFFLVNILNFRNKNESCAPMWFSQIATRDSLALPGKCLGPLVEPVFQPNWIVLSATLHF